MRPYIPAILFALIILGLSGVSGNQLPQLQINIWQPDKIAHALVYFVFSVLLMYGFHRQNGYLSKKYVLLAVGISIGYGILMEFAQYFIFTGRYFELYDILANTIGTLSSILLTKFFNKTLSE